MKNKFPFRKTFKIDAQVFLHLPEILGSEAKYFHLEGKREIEFTETDKEDCAALKITAIDFTLSEFTIAYGSPIFFRKKLIHFPPLHFNTSNVCMEHYDGIVNLKTGEFFLSFKVIFQTKKMPFFYDLGVDEEIPLIISEVGKMDIKDEKCHSWFGLKLSPTYRGLFRIGCWGKSCSTEAFICATVNGSTCERKSDVMICKGEPVYLTWRTNNADEIHIDPEPGPVGPSGDAIIVKPSKTTTYKIEAKGKDCSATDEVTVYVIEEGSIIDIQANPKPSQEIWEYKALETFCSRNILITSIAPLCSLGCFVHKPLITGYKYLKCGSIYCNGDWFGNKINLDGSMHSFNVPSAKIPLPYLPLVGTWQFVPMVGPYEFTGYGYFRLTATCKKP